MKSGAGFACIFAVFLFAVFFAKVGEAKPTKNSKKETPLESRSENADDLGTAVPVLDAPQGAAWEDYGKNVLTARIGYTTANLGIDVEDRVGSGHAVELRPNVPQSFFVSASHDWLALRLAVASSMGEASDSKGKTTAQDYQLRFNFPRLSFDFFYQNYKGFYVDNSQSFGAAPNTPILAPDLRAEHIGAGFIYNLNSDQFSIPAAIDQTARQTSTGWSYLAGGSIHSNRFSTPVALVPISEIPAYGSFSEVRSARLTSLLVGGGVGGAWVFARNWHLSGAAMAYAGMEQTRVDKISGVNTDSHMPVKSSVKAAVGYNGSRYLYGLSMQADAANYEVENASMRFTATSLSVYFGSHIDL